MSDEKPELRLVYDGRVLGITPIISSSAVREDRARAYDAGYAAAVRDTQTPTRGEVLDAVYAVLARYGDSEWVVRVTGEIVAALPAGSLTLECQPECRWDRPCSLECERRETRRRRVMKDGT